MCNTVLFFQTMSSRMNFTDLMMFLYFNKCLLDNPLEEWQSVTPHEENQTVENFKYLLEEWFSALPPGNVFLIHKEWMTNTMKKPFIMRVKDIGNRLKTVNQFFALMPHDEDKDKIFLDTDLKALLLKSIPSTCQNSYLLKGTRVTDNFQQMLASFVQFESITDTQTATRPNSASAILDQRQQDKYTCNKSGQRSCFHFSHHRSLMDSNQIPRKTNFTLQGLFVECKRP